MIRQQPITAGFSLVETLISTAIFSIVCAAIMVVFRVVLATEGIAARDAILIDTVEAGMAALDREIGEATVSLASSGTMSLAIDVPIFDFSGVPTGGVDRVVFTASGSSLLQSVLPGSGSTRPALANKRLLAALPVPYPMPGPFTYFRRLEGTMVAVPPQDATVVRVQLIQQGAYAGRSRKVTMACDIRMRNRSL